MRCRYLFLTVIVAVIAYLAISLLVKGPASNAFVVPGNAHIGAGSRWEYDSNLGPVVVEMIDRFDTPPRTFYRWRLSLRGLVYEEWLELLPGQLFTWERSFSAFGLLKEKHSYPQPEYTMPSPPTVGARWSWQGTVRPEPLGADPWAFPAPAVTLATAATTASGGTTTGAKSQATAKGSQAAGQGSQATAAKSTPDSAKLTQAAVNSQSPTHTALASGHVRGVETMETPAGRFTTYRIYLERSDSLGMEQTMEIWLNPDIGVIAAEGDLRWGGLPGKIQRLIGLEHLSVRLRKYQLK